MKKSIKIGVSALIAALKKTKEVITAKPTMPILDNVLFKVRTDSVLVIATDLLVTIEANIPIESGSQYGYYFLLPFEFLYKYLHQVNTTDITIELVERAGRVNGQNKYYTDVTITSFLDNVVLEDLDDPAMYPELPQLPGDNTAGICDELITWLVNAIDTCSSDKLRPAMQKIYMGISEGTITIASTDAKVLMEKKFEADTHTTAELLIDTRIAKALNGFVDASIYWSDTHLAFVNDKIKIIATLQDEKYPDYRAIIPELISIGNMEILLNELKGAFEKVALTKTNATIYFRREIGTVVIESVDTDYNRKITSRIQVSYAGACDMITFQPEGMLALLGQISYNKINLNISAFNRPIVITAEADSSYRAIVMPMVKE